MKRLTDKIAILLLCLVGFSFSELAAAPVAALLIALSATALASLYEGSRTADAIVLTGSVCCLFFPLLFCAMPIMLYDAFRQKKPWLALPTLLGLFGGSTLTHEQLLLTFIGGVIAAVLYLRVASLEESVSKLLSLRNEVEEQNLKLADRNIRLAEAQDNEVHLATLRERNRIAREIHDNVGHMLTRSLLQAGAILIINKDDNLKEPLTELKDTLNTAMTSIRESVHDLHDESVDFKAVVNESIRSVSDRFRVKLDCDYEGELPVRIRLCFIAIIKEGLSNAVKHSKGDRIDITVREHPAFYQLSVEDNGACDPEAEMSSDGIGLQNMRDRAAAVGGRVSFTPSEHGFRIFMTAPKQTGEKEI